jgi:predicted nucleic acid-binding protein
LATYVDTSALYALIVAGDPDHADARVTLAELQAERDPLVTHSYAVAETIALLQRRVGLEGVRRLSALLPLLTIRWVDRELHERVLEAVLASDRRSVSFVDRISFTVMRDLGMKRAFSLDADFVDEGFEVIPG